MLFAVGSRPYEQSRLESGDSLNRSDYRLTGRVSELPLERQNDDFTTCMSYIVLAVLAGLFIAGISVMMLYGDTRIYTAYTDTLRALNIGVR